MRSVNLPLSGRELPKTCGGWSAGDAPHPPFAIPVGTSSAGWRADPPRRHVRWCLRAYRRKIQPRSGVLVDHRRAADQAQTWGQTMRGEISE